MADTEKRKRSASFEYKLRGGSWEPFGLVIANDPGQKSRYGRHARDALRRRFGKGAGLFSTRWVDHD